MDTYTSIETNEIKNIAVAYKRWCSDNEHDLRLENMNYLNSSYAITDGELFDAFYKQYQDKKYNAATK